MLTAAVGVLEGVGAEIVPIKLPLYDELITVMMIGMPAEAYAYHRNDLATRWDEFSSGAHAHVLTGALLSGGDYVQIQRVRRAEQRQVAALFDNLDLIVTPTGSATAPELDNVTFESALKPMQAEYWNSIGNPALSVPMGFDGNGMPAGMQIIGNPFDEAGVLAAGHAYQQCTSWHRQTPTLTSP